MKLRLLTPVVWAATAAVLSILSMDGATAPGHYFVLAPMVAGNLTLFPVVSDNTFDSRRFLTLDEGMRSGKVTVTEKKRIEGLVRPTPSDGIWREVPPLNAPFALPPSSHLRRDGARANRLTLQNDSDHPLLLLAGEIVTGGRQDRVVARDRIVPAHSEPVDLDVFCVEPQRWTGPSITFENFRYLMAQPSVRRSALADQDQEEVWMAVEQAREVLLAGGSEGRQPWTQSSYASLAQAPEVRKQIDSIAGPLEHLYNKLPDSLRAQHAVGLVASINQQIVWADVFADAGLLERYWPKLIRSYAAEALAPSLFPTAARAPATRAAAQAFLDRWNGKRENIESEPGVYRNTQISGDDFDAFLLTSLLPDLNTNVHVAKMLR